MELFKASEQWASRPADERFESLAALYEATKAYADQAQEKSVPVSVLRTEARGKEVALVGKADIPATLTHWAFGQLAARAGAPAGYLRQLPATLASQNLNHGLSRLADRDATANILFHSNSGLVVRALTSDQYERIWNYEVAARLLDLEGKGWKPAKPTFRFDGGKLDECQACDGKGGDCKHCVGTGKVYPALYASDHDMFAFIMLENRPIAQPVDASLPPLYRGLIYENSEVGAKKIRATRFAFNKVCGNFIIWDAKDVVTLSARHVGTVRDKVQNFEIEIAKYANESASDEEAKIKRAARVTIAKTKEELLDKLFGIRSLGLSRKVLEGGYDAVIPEQDGSPNTQWGIVQGLSRHSQKTPFADERTAIDRAAGKILEIEF